MIYTVGHATSYRQGIREQSEKGEKLFKLGPRPASADREAYTGGFAVHTIKDAWRLIDEHGKQGEWEPFGLVADWDLDTKPTTSGWWRDLQRDAEIIDLRGDVTSSRVTRRVRSVGSEELEW